MGRQERQLGFSDWERSVVKKQTRREKFLIASFYPVQGPQGGRLAETMLRIHLMQHWYCLSDEAMEDALIEVESMRRFAHLHLAKGWIPDASTILAFRHFLEKHDLGAKLFERVGEVRTRSAAEGRHGCGYHHHSCTHLHQEREEGERPGDASNPQG